MSSVETSEPMPGVTVLTLSRPEALNTMNVDLVADLHVELDRIAADRACRVIVLTGAGRAFCAGLDLNGYGDPERIEQMGFALGTLDRQREIAGLVEKHRGVPRAAVHEAAGPYPRGRRHLPTGVAPREDRRARRALRHSPDPRTRWIRTWKATQAHQHPRAGPDPHDAGCARTEERRARSRAVRGVGTHLLPARASRRRLRCGAGSRKGPPRPDSASPRHHCGHTRPD